MVFFYFIKHLKSRPAKTRCYENTFHGLNQDVILSASIRKTMIHRSGVSETSGNPFNQTQNKEKIFLYAPQDVHPLYSEFFKCNCAFYSNKIGFCNRSVL